MPDQEPNDNTSMRWIEYDCFEHTSRFRIEKWPLDQPLPPDARPHRYDEPEGDGFRCVPAHE